MAELARRARHPLDFRRLTREAFVPASFDRFRGKLAPLPMHLGELTRR